MNACSSCELLGAKVAQLQADLVRATSEARLRDQLLELHKKNAASARRKILHFRDLSQKMLMKRAADERELGEKADKELARGLDYAASLMIGAPLPDEDEAESKGNPESGPDAAA